MIKNSKKIEEFENQHALNESMSYEQALAIYEALINEAVALGAINSENIMDGFEVDIRVAKALNALK